MSNKNRIKEELSDIISEDSENTKINFKESTDNLRLDDNTLIRCKSNVYGKLIYINTRTGETTNWEMCGEVQELSLGDLRVMKSSQPAFFVNQWIIILGVVPNSGSNAKPADIYKSLGIVKYYTNLLEISNYDEICGWTEKDIRSKVPMLDDSAKNKLIVAVSEFISRELIDSKKQIRAFSETLGVDFE